MEDDAKPEGAPAEIDYDHMRVERFRETFPRARRDDERKSWWVPGKTADHRIAKWRALEQSRADIHADDKGRDAFLFDPIESDCLEAAAELVVRTTYSPTVVSELRQVPFAGGTMSAGPGWCHTADTTSWQSAGRTSKPQHGATSRRPAGNDRSRPPGPLNMRPRNFGQPNSGSDVSLCQSTIRHL